MEIGKSARCDRFGPPGAGKSVLASHPPSILPFPTKERMGTRATAR